MEDDEAERQGIVELLRVWGYEAKAAPDGIEALRELASSPFDLVLSDLRMPRMSGADLLTELRRWRVCVMYIMISGEQNGLEEATRVGADSFLAKPIDPTLLKAAVERYLAAQQTSERGGGGSESIGGATRKS